MKRKSVFFVITIIVISALVFAGCNKKSGNNSNINTNPPVSQSGNVTVTADPNRGNGEKWWADTDLSKYIPKPDGIIKDYTSVNDADTHGWFTMEWKSKSERDAYIVKAIEAGYEEVQDDGQEWIGAKIVSPGSWDNLRVEFWVDDVFGPSGSIKLSLGK